jgi:hypothetical protein
MSSDTPSKLYFSLSIFWKDDDRTSFYVYSIDPKSKRKDIRQKLMLLLEYQELTWVDTGEKYDLKSAMKKVVQIIKNGTFTEPLYAHDLLHGGDYLFPVSFTFTPQRIIEL